MFSFMTEVK